MKKSIKVIILVVLLISSISLYFVIKNQTLPIYTMSKYGMTITNDDREYSISITQHTKRIGKRIGKGEFGGEKFYVYEEKGKDKQEYIIVNSEIHEGYIEYKNEFNK